MANKTPTPTNEQKLMSIPSEAEVQKSFQEHTYIRPVPTTDGLGSRRDYDGPIYPTWAYYKATHREPSPVRQATALEIQTYNSIIRSTGEPAARQWLNREWS